MSENQLTEKQKKLLELIYEDGLPYELIKKANSVKVQAGYSENSSISSILSTLKQEIVDRNLWYMVVDSGQSILALQEVVRTPTKPGSDNIIKAANSILDRTGFGKKETQEVELKADKGIVILPPKLD